MRPTAASSSAATASPRRLGLFDAVCTMIGIILGTGIFMAPAKVAAVVPARGWASAVWLGGGLVALCGAVCYAECASRLPRDGGFFLYFERAFGAPVARIAGWAAWLVTYPASLTATAWVAASYLQGMLRPASSSPAPTAAGLLLACAAIVALGVQAGARLQRVLTACKIIAIVAVAGAAAWHSRAAGGGPPAAPVGLQVLPMSPALCLTAFAATMWTFDGWSDITMLAGELRDPRRNLIRAVAWGIMIPAACYALLQAAVMTLLPAEVAMRSGHVLLAALEVMGGPQAALGLGCLAIVCAVGALHGVMSAVCRLGWSMAVAGEVPRVFAHRPARLGTPLAALAVPVALALAYLASGNFNDLLGYFAFGVWLYYALTAVAMLRLRTLRVGEADAWRAPGGPLAPGVVIAAAAVMSGLQLYEHPWRTLVGVGSVAACAGMHRIVVAVGSRHLARPPAR